MLRREPRRVLRFSQWRTAGQAGDGPVLQHVGDQVVVGAKQLEEARSGPACPTRHAGRPRRCRCRRPDEAPRELDVAHRHDGVAGRPAAFDQQVPAVRQAYGEGARFQASREGHGLTGGERQIARQRRRGRRRSPGPGRRQGGSAGPRAEASSKCLVMSGMRPCLNSRRNGLRGRQALRRGTWRRRHRRC